MFDHFALSRNHLRAMLAATFFGAYKHTTNRGLDQRPILFDLGDRVQTRVQTTAHPPSRAIQTRARAALLICNRSPQLFKKTRSIPGCCLKGNAPLPAWPDPRALLQAGQHGITTPSTKAIAPMVAMFFAIPISLLVWPAAAYCNHCVEYLALPSPL